MLKLCQFYFCVCVYVNYSFKHEKWAMASDSVGFCTCSAHFSFIFLENMACQCIKKFNRKDLFLTEDDLCPTVFASKLEFLIDVSL